MLVKKKITKTKKTSLAVIGILIAVLIGYLLITNFILEDKKLTRRDRSPAVEIVIPQVLITEFESDFINQSPFTDLVLPPRAKLPVTVDNMGRSNPFQEISF
ncbi:MAG: hypothetical protein CMI53_01155 [Parcubacteria group bacterium]|jgi:hypothetical protein|nr:hypothetical protein [Parcubacteria group bacterium]|tara:strand:- start:3093 stop:3398 length:306 start_codon:yes stop_codon:yes gene_type:complete